VRIISGSVGGRTLKSRTGRDTRPTADRVREAIFNILLARQEPPPRVLDLYAGTGALGLEALSRGVSEAVFVESDREACDLIRENARALGFSHVTVEETKVLRYQPSGRFGWIFLDPPYASSETGELDKALRRVEPHLDDEGIVIAEHEWRNAPSEKHGALARIEVRRYGQTAVSFYRRSHE
jgi:16S rRNA (guanine(966)-N(2))-methyltransferase RsmD